MPSNLNKLLATNKELKAILSLRKSFLILSSGMYRSGSTLLFNIIRQVGQAKWGTDVYSCWHEDMLSGNNHKYIIAKTHEISRPMAWKSSAIFYTYRDMRTAAVSRKRRFGVEPEIAHFISAIRQYKRMKSAANMCIKYEDLLANTALVVSQIIHELDRLDSKNCCRPESIIANIREINAPESGEKYDSRSLLHANHLTYTQNDEWRQELSIGLQKDVNFRFGWWFRECGYPEE